MKRLIAVSLLWVGVLVISQAAYAGITLGPYLLDMHPTSVTICWENDSISAYSVHYGTDDLDLVWEDPTGTTFRCARLEGLAPGTTYRYRVASGLDKYPDGSFTTPLEDEETLRFAVYGDTRTDHDRHRLAVGILMRLAPDFVVHTGDFVDDGDHQDEWHTFFDIVLALLSRTPMVPVIGNHDNRTGTFFDQYFPMASHPDGAPRRYYVYDRAGVRFIILSTETAYHEGSDQHTWLVEELKKASADPSVRHLIATFHRPAFNSGHHSEDSAEVAAVFPELFAKYGVELVLSGHAHNYERSMVDGVTYVTSGGGGAPNVWALEDQRMNPDDNPHSDVYLAIIHACLVETTPDCLTVTVHDTAGVVRDEVKIGKCQWEPGRIVSAEPEAPETEREPGATDGTAASPADPIPCPPCAESGPANKGCSTGGTSQGNGFLLLLLMAFLACLSSVNSLKSGLVSASQRAVDLPRQFLKLPGFFVDIAHYASGDSHCDLFGGDLCRLPDDGALADHAVLADNGPIADNGSHAYDRTVVDGAVV